MKKVILLSIFMLLVSCGENNFTPQIEMKETRGNGDNIPNKGEELLLGISTNGILKDQVMKLSSSSPFLKTFTETSDTQYLSNEQRRAEFKIEIDNSTPPNTDIPLVLKYKNILGIESTLDYSIKIAEIDNNISIQKIELKEEHGNGDNIPNKGEIISFNVTFLNSGKSSTNNLRVSVSTTSKFIDSFESNVSTESLKPNAPRKSEDMRLTIKDDTPLNTRINLNFKLKDDFGNEYNTSSSFIVE